MKKHYEVVVDTSDRQLTVNVFAESEDKKDIKELAIKESIRFMAELGVECNPSELTPIGYKEKPQFV